MLLLKKEIKKERQFKKCYKSQFVAGAIQKNYGRPPPSKIVSVLHSGQRLEALSHLRATHQHRRKANVRT